MTTDTLPRAYSDTAAEYRSVTEGAGLHDNSRAGRLKATGEDALDLLNRLSTNGVVNLRPGRGAPTILTTDRGRILDLLGVVNTGDYTLLLTSPGCQPAVIQWLDKYTIMEDLVVEDLTPATALLTVCGPQSGAVLSTVLAADVGEPAALEAYATLTAAIAGQEVLAIRRPLGRLDAFDLLLARQSAPPVWAALAESGIPPVGLDAYEAALVQQAVPRHGRELGDAYNPLEAGLIGSIDFAKGCYIGQEVIARLDTYQKVQRYLVRLRFSDAAQVSEGTGLEQEGRNVGKVTSLATLPTTGEMVGLGYVRTARAAPGAWLTLAAPAQGRAEVLDLPQLFGPGE